MIGSAAAGTCGVSAPPNITLSELHSGCNTHTRSRHSDCVAAMHRFCGRVTYATGMTTLGVSREVGIDRIGMSCIRSRWSGDVSITTLQRYHARCTSGKSQHRDCLSAIHRYCNATLGSNFAGTSQEVLPLNNLYVKCFQSPRKELVSHAVLQSHHSGCVFPNSDSDFCYSAASRWCVSLGYTGGITQEVISAGVTVACYSAEFSDDEFVTRSSDFYDAQLHVAHICSLTFDITNGNVSSQNTLFLKTETYDNRASNVILHSNFHVSKEIVESSSFSHDHTYAIGNGVSVSVRYPVFDGSSINIMSSATHTVTFSLTRKTMQTKSYTAQVCVEVPAGEAILKEASVQQATLDVPWSARIINGLGVASTIHGQWSGVSTYNLQVTQRDIDGICPCSQQ